MTVLLTGATGRIGSRVSGILQAQGVVYYAAVRNPDAPNERTFDWRAPNTWQVATKSISTVFLMTPENMGNMSDQVEAFLTVAKDEGVNRIVLLSALGVDHDDHGTGMAHIEAVVRWNFENSCIFRPNTFMQNFSEGAFYPSIQNQGALVAPLSDTKVSFIDLSDIAECVAQALTDPTLNGEKVLSGGQALSFGQAAAIISSEVGRDIGFRNVCDEDMKNILHQTGMPPHLIDMVLGFYVSLRNPAHAAVTSNVEHITGKPPRTFTDFVGANREAWNEDV